MLIVLQLITKTLFIWLLRWLNLCCVYYNINKAFWTFFQYNKILDNSSFVDMFITIYVFIVILKAIKVIKPQVKLAGNFVSC